VKSCYRTDHRTLKQDHRVGINFLKGTIGNEINFVMAVSAFNYKKVMKKLRAKALWHYAKLEIVETIIEIQMKIRGFEIVSVTNRAF
jgi:hypothetical protein